MMMKKEIKELIEKSKDAKLIYDAGYKDRSIQEMWIRFHEMGLGEFASKRIDKKFPTAATIEFNDEYLSGIYNAMLYLIQVHDGIIERDENCLPENRHNKAIDRLK